MTTSWDTVLENTKEIPDNWRTSLTKLAPKVSKPTLKGFQPIALTNTSYNILMAIKRDKIDDYLYKDNLTMDTLSGFTGGRRMENNLLTLNSFRGKKNLHSNSRRFSKSMLFH